MSNNNINVEIENKAFSKIMLHVLKHVSSDCYGLLIGSNKNSSFTVVDAIPLFHNRVFTPQTDIALRMVELNLNKNECIIGMYENVIIEPKVFRGSNEALGICEPIHNKLCKNPILLQITTEKVTDTFIGGNKALRSQDAPEFKIYSYNEKGSFDVVKSYTESKSQHDDITKLVENKKVTEIVDFDDHFENVNLDWRNKFIN